MCLTYITRNAPLQVFGFLTLLDVGLNGFTIVNLCVMVRRNPLLYDMFAATSPTTSSVHRPSNSRFCCAEESLRAAQMNPRRGEWSQHGPFEVDLFLGPFFRRSRTRAAEYAYICMHTPRASHSCRRKAPVWPSPRLIGQRNVRRNVWYRLVPESMGRTHAPDVLFFSGLKREGTTSGTLNPPINYHGILPWCIFFLP